MPIHQGAIFNNRFQIISQEPLGAGGMGQVWLAYDRTLDKKLVLKFVNVGFGLDSQAEADLKREVKLAQELNHPNIVRINDIHNEGKLFFISMAYIEGLDLVKWRYQRGSNFSPLELLQVIKPICDAVHYAHSRKILHLDLKPSNMMVDRHGCVYLLDFGIARAAQESLTRITRAAGFSPGYAAPEQVQGQEADRRTDVYGLAASCYHLLNGRPPFYKGDISYQTINIAPQPIEGLPEPINSVILKGLAKEKEERYAKASEFYYALEEAVNQKPIDIDVPNCIGMLFTNAESKVRNQGLKIVITSEKYDDRIAAGAIIEQKPRTGLKVECGSVIEVVLSKGSKIPPKPPEPAEETVTELYQTPTPAVIDSKLEKSVYNRTKKKSLAWLWWILILSLVIPAIIIGANTNWFGISNRKEWKGANLETKVVGPGIKLIRIPGGTFQMGSNEGKADEKPVHPVTVDSFWMGETEVTIGQYVAFLNEVKPSSSQLQQWISLDQYAHITQSGNRYSADSDWGDHPVVNVSWYGARDFCTQYNLRLPTEAEWEYAAGGPKHYEFPWGNEWNKNACCNRDNQGDGSPPSMNVGLFQPNGYSLYDMAGNVWEWCSDWYDVYPGGSRNAVMGDKYRVLHGGCWINVSARLRCAGRGRDDPSLQDRDCGIRVSGD